MGIVVSPRSEFYELYTIEQIDEIVHSLEDFREIPHKYTYFKDSAELWDQYANRMADEGRPNSLNSTIKLLDLSYGYLNELLGSEKVINIVDIGPGNVLPVKNLLECLNRDGRLYTYRAVDISQEMLALARQHVEQWFDGKVAFEEHLLDFGEDNFPSHFAKVLRADDVANVVLFLGGTIGNTRSPEEIYKKIQASLDGTDIFILGLKLDTLNSRNYFSFTEGSNVDSLPKMEASILRHLNVTPDYYTVEKGYDPVAKRRYIRIRLKQDATIKFVLGNKTKDVALRKNEAVLLWRYWHYDSLDILHQLESAGFTLLHASLTSDRETLVAITRANKGFESNRLKRADLKY